MSWGIEGWGTKHWGVLLPEGQTRSFIADTSDIGATISSSESNTEDIGATLVPLHTFDLIAIISATQGVGIIGTLTTIPSVDLGSTMQTIPSVNLGAIGGAHPPENITATLAAVLHVDMAVYIRGGFSDTFDLAASLTQIGGFSDMGAFAQAAIRSTYDLGVSMRVISQATKDLVAALQPIHEDDFPASIITQRILDARAIIYGWARQVESNMSAYLRRIDSETSNLPVVPLKSVISTHTADKSPNLTKVQRRFFENRYAFGTRTAGLLLLTLEPIFGNFPDLHAQIFAQAFFRDNLGGFIRVATSQIDNMSGRLTSVVDFVNISKLVIELVPLINMTSVLVQVGGFLRMRANITPVHVSSTGTAADAGFVTTASSYRFYLGTSKGLFIPPQVLPTLRISTYSNTFPRPDLHATIGGWYVSDMGASIGDLITAFLGASLTSLDLSHVGNLSAFIEPFYLLDLGASLTVSGGVRNLLASLTVTGVIDDFPASLVPNITPLASSIVSVLTMPIADMGAIINYNLVRRCSPTSMVSEVSAYVKAVLAGPPAAGDISAELNALSALNDMAAEAIARKRTRIRIISLTFRTKTRASSPIRGSITPLAKLTFGLGGTITGLSHEKDLAADLTPFRFSADNIAFTASELVANLKTGEVKTVLVSFRSQVKTYIYDAVSSAVYSTDRGTWAIDLRSLIRDESFFDRSLLNREIVISDGLLEFYSLDEALRSALVVLCERRQFTLGATLNARGAIRDLSAQIGVSAADQLGVLPASLVAVVNSPDITATINSMSQFSNFFSTTASITPEYVQVNENLTGSLTGNIVDDLGAELVVT